VNVFSSNRSDRSDRSDHFTANETLKAGDGNPLKREKQSEK